MRKVEIRGWDGRVVSAIINDPANIAAVKEFVILPVFISNNGDPREVRLMAQESF